MKVDFVNSMFTLGGAYFLWYNVLQLYRDKEVKGTSLLSTSFFLFLSIWQVIYYWENGHLLSILTGLLAVGANFTWVVLARKYNNRDIS